MDSGRNKRRLATILAADVAGYSALMAQDEEATVRTLRAFRDVIDKLIARHDGRVFNTAGDAVLAEFGSAVEAVRCAITIQDELRVRNAELVPERQMQFRIGVNVGDVLVEGDDRDALALAGRGLVLFLAVEGIDLRHRRTARHGHGRRHQRDQRDGTLGGHQAAHWALEAAGCCGMAGASWLSGGVGGESSSCGKRESNTIEITRRGDTKCGRTR